MQSPVNLNIWHRSLALAVCVEHLATRIPAVRAPGIANQLRRASSSIPANIAEGAGQDSPSQCARFISIALASAFELESHLCLVQRLFPELTSVDSALDELRQIRRMMYAFRRHQVKKGGGRERRPATDAE